MSRWTVFMGVRVVYDVENVSPRYDAVAETVYEKIVDALSKEGAGYVWGLNMFRNRHEFSDEISAILSKFIGHNIVLVDSGFLISENGCIASAVVYSRFGVENVQIYRCGEKYTYYYEVQHISFDPEKLRELIEKNAETKHRVLYLLADIEGLGSWKVFSMLLLGINIPYPVELHIENNMLRIRMLIDRYVYDIVIKRDNV